jgi:2-polyprenyl-3-methyl-5-hydroxy-6-metoxy-1,4-benzoquinol methylase
VVAIDRQRTLTTNSTSTAELTVATFSIEHSSRKHAEYYAALNDHVLNAVIRTGGKKFLDVGCASGVLGAAIKERVPGASVDGIELSASAAANAVEVLDNVYQLDLNRQSLELDDRYDGVICGDVLEHLIDPWAVLRRLVGLLKEGGVLVTSIPNIRHYKVLRDLVMKGRFEYRESGILDVTHLRFFTLIEMKKLLEDAGLEISHIEPRVRGKNGLMLLLDRLSGGRMRDFRTVQYTLSGIKR